MIPNGYTDDNIHELEILADSEGQLLAATYKCEAARLAEKRTQRMELGAEEIAYQRGETEWWSTNWCTYSSTEWADWNNGVRNAD